MTKKNLTKVEVIQIFKESFPEVIADKTDKPKQRFTWNTFVDGLQKDGQITEKQASTWDQPKFIKGY